MTVLDRIFDTQVDTQKIFVPVKTAFKIRKDVLTKEGTSPIYLYITGFSKVLRINLELHVAPKLWLQKEERAKPINAMYEDLNLVLDHISSKISAIKIRYRLSNRILSPQTLSEELAEGNHRIYFTSYMRQKIKENKSLREGTARRYQSIANKLDIYRPELTFSDITETFIFKFRNHMLEKGNKVTTVNSNIKAIKIFLRQAKKKDGIIISVDLDEITVGNTNGNRTALSPGETRTLCRYYFDKRLKDSQQLTLGYFLFSCMTGLRVSDILDLNRDELLQSDFSFVNIKSNKDQTISLNQMARKIVEFTPELFVTKYHLNKFNIDLKRIAKNNKIRKHVTFHVSRHTFATNFLRMGGKIEHLQKLMAHSKIETTMIYVHILASEANNEIHKLDELFKDHGFNLDLE